MQHHEGMKAKATSPGFQDTGQQEVAALAQAFERWLDDGGTSDRKAASEVGAGDVSPLQFFSKPQGGLI